MLRDILRFDRKIVFDPSPAPIETPCEQGARAALPAVVCTLPLDAFDVTPTPHCTPAKPHAEVEVGAWDPPTSDAGAFVTHPAVGRPTVPPDFDEAVGGTRRVTPAPPTPGDGGVIMLKTPPLAARPSPALRDYEECLPADACGVGSYDHCGGMEVLDFASPSPLPAQRAVPAQPQGYSARPQAAAAALPPAPRPARSRSRTPQQRRASSGTRGRRGVPHPYTTLSPAGSRRSRTPREDDDDPVHIRLYCGAIEQQQRRRAKQRAASATKQCEEDRVRASGMNARRVVMTPTKLQRVVDHLASTATKDRHIGELRARAQRDALRECTFAPAVARNQARRVDEPFEQRLHREAQRRRAARDATRAAQLQAERVTTEREKRRCNPKYAARAAAREQRAREAQ